RIIRAAFHVIHIKALCTAKSALISAVKRHLIRIFLREDSHRRTSERQAKDQYESQKHAWTFSFSFHPLCHDLWSPFRFLRRFFIVPTARIKSAVPLTNAAAQSPSICVGS